MKSVAISRHFEVEEGQDLRISKFDDKIKVLDRNGYSLPGITAVDIYEDQVQGWYFDVVRDIEEKLNSEQLKHAGFVILMACVGFFEHHAQFLFGLNTKYRSNKCFRLSFLSYAKWSDAKYRTQLRNEKIADRLYLDVRSGLFHAAITRRGIELTRTIEQSIVPPSTDTGTALKINPFKLNEELKEYFTEYINMLRDMDQQYQTYRDNFVKGWQIRYGEISEEERASFARSPSHFITSQNLPISPSTAGTSLYPPEKSQQNMGGAISSNEHTDQDYRPITYDGDSKDDQ